MGENREINKELIELINEYLPKNISLVNTICEILDIHKESAYRRIRGEVKFNFEEVIKIQETLRLPIERLFKESNTTTSIEFKAQLISDSPLYKDDYCLSVLEIMDDRRLTSYNSYRVCNTLPYNFIFKHELTSKMHYYKWLSKKHTPFEHQYVLSNEIPKNVRQRQLQVKEYFESKNTTYIISDDMFESYCKEIKHLKFLGYISDVEMDQIKAELNLIVDEISVLCVNEYFETGKSVKIYISKIDIPTSFSYLKSDSQNEEGQDASVHALFGTTSYFLTYNEDITNMTKNFFENLLNHSTLVTQSGVKYRLPYLAKQRKLISSM